MTFHYPLKTLLRRHSDPLTLSPLIFMVQRPHLPFKAKVTPAQHLSRFCEMKHPIVTNAFKYLLFRFSQAIWTAGGQSSLISWQESEQLRTIVWLDQGAHYKIWASTQVFWVPHLLPQCSLDHCFSNFFPWDQQLNNNNILFAQTLLKQKFYRILIFMT